MIKNTILLFFIACSSKNVAPESIYITMNKLWKDKVSKEQLIIKLGDNYKTVEDAIIYPFSSPESISSVHWFKEGILNEQIIFLDEKSLDKMRSDIPCQWEETEQNEDHGHIIYSVRRGKCKQSSIEYNYRPGYANFEVRWKSL